MTLDHEMEHIDSKPDRPPLENVARMIVPNDDRATRGPCDDGP